MQMIMGAGKTTCIGPMLALMLADGAALVTQCVPNQLLAQSWEVMWLRFSQVVQKKILTFDFDRAHCTVERGQRLLCKLDAARCSGGIVVTTPTAVKSLVNKFVELLAELHRAPLASATAAESERASRMAPPPAGGRPKDTPAARRLRSVGKALELKARSADTLAKIIDLWR